MQLSVVKCERVYRVACEYKWYKLEPRNAKCLIIIMIQSNKPLHLTAGKFFPMTMTTLCNVSRLQYITNIAINCSFNNFCIYCFQVQRSKKKIYLCHWLTPFFFTSFNKAQYYFCFQLLKMSVGYVSVLLARG